MGTLPRRGVIQVKQTIQSRGPSWAPRLVDFDLLERDRRAIAQRQDTAFVVTDFTRSGIGLRALHDPRFESAGVAVIAKTIRHQRLRDRTGRGQNVALSHGDISVDVIP